jgi:hypothetical protein
MGPKTLDDLVKRLKAPQARTRDLAAAELGDWIESDQLAEKDFRNIVSALVEAALNEKHANAKESMFNALSSASTARPKGYGAWEPIAQSLASLDVACLEHALLILGWSANPQFRHAIQPYLKHSDQTIRETAADALQMLEPRTRKVAKGG